MEHRAADPLDTQVKCRGCGAAQRVSFAECVKLGWPMCCGETMALVTHPDPADIERKLADSGIFQVPDHLRAMGDEP